MSEPMDTSSTTTTATPSAPSAPTVDAVPSASAVPLGPPGGAALNSNVENKKEEQQAPAVVPDNKETPTETAKSDPSTLDLVFCVDATGSMGSYINAAQKNICSIVEQIVASEKCDVRFGLIAYRDHPPQDTSFVTKVYPFTDSLKLMQKNVGELSAAGGGDGPEAVAAGLEAALKMDYRKNSTRVCVIIADAPPHGLGENGDGFPNGDPDGRDPVKIARQMLEAGIVIYSVACEPALSHYQFAADFFQGIAAITKGQFLPLGGANLLAEVIIGGAKEQIALERLMAEVDKVAAQVKAQNKNLDEAGVSREVAKEMRSRNVEAYSVAVDDLYEANHQAVLNVGYLEKCEDLSAWRKNKDVKPAARKLKSDVLLPGGGGGVSAGYSGMDRGERLEMLESMEVKMDGESFRRRASKPSGGGFLSSVRNMFSSSAKKKEKEVMESEEDDDVMASAPMAMAAPAPPSAKMEQQVRHSKAVVSEEQVERMYAMNKARSKMG